MSNGLIFAAIAGIGITLFIGAGGLKKIENLIPKDLKEKVSDKANEATNTPTEKKENDVIPESPNKKLTKELEEKLPTPDTIQENPERQQLRDRILDAGNYGRKDASQTLGMSDTERKKQRLAREIIIPDNVKYSTSLAGAPLVSGTQFKRNTDTAKEIQKREAARAQTISTLLYGNVQNAKFVKDAENYTRPNNTTTKAKSSKESNAERLKAALEFNKKVLEAKSK